MSRRARAGETINGGFLVGVSPADFGGTGPLAGGALQGFHTGQDRLRRGKAPKFPVEQGQRPPERTSNLFRQAV